MYNKVVMVGNLTRDIELRYMPSGAALAKGAIATSHRFKTQAGEKKEEVCFLDFNIFGRSAEVANQYLRKGSKVLLEGRLVFEQWVAQDGTNRNRHSLRVDTMTMLDSKADSMQQQQNPSYSNNQGMENSYNQSSMQQQNNQYNAPSQQQAYNNGGMNNQAKSYEQKIPEIDIDEDEIPF